MRVSVLDWYPLPGPEAESLTVQLDRMRYEVKLQAERHLLGEVFTWLRLHPVGLGTPYPDRQVNSVYFDTPDLDNYWENKAGIGERRKVRVRWYGEGESVSPTCEVKFKRGELGWKLQHPLPPIPSLRDASWAALRRAWRAALPPEMRMWLERYPEPVLRNSYQRAYLGTRDGSVRVTVDYDERVYDERFFARPNLRGPAFVPGRVIVEVKAAATYREDVVRLVESLPLRIYPNSKYANGVELIAA